jgi:DNA polymerase-1
MDFDICQELFSFVYPLTNNSFCAILTSSMTKNQPCRPLVVSELNPPLNYTLITDAAGLAKLQEYFTRVTEFALDVETNMTDTFYDRRVRTIQVGDRNEQFIIDVLAFADYQSATLEATQGNFGCAPFSEIYKDLVAVLNPVLDSNKWLKLGHNLQFDYEMLKWNFGIRMWNIYDTYLAEQVIYAGKVPFGVHGFWALDDCVCHYAKLQISKDEQTKFNLSDALRTEQLDYCALDCRLPFAIRAGQAKELDKGNLWNTLTLENNASAAFADMKLNGLLVDRTLWMAQVAKVEEDHKKNVARLDELFIPIVGAKNSDNANLDALECLWRDEKDKEKRAEYRKAFMAARKERTRIARERDKFEGEAAINYGSNPQLLASLRKLGYGKDKLKDTNDRSLKKACANPNLDVEKAKKIDPTLQKFDVLDVLRLYRETKKVLTTYGETFLENHIHPVTGRIHSTIKQMGAETGRTSSVKPNVQNILRGADWRGCFIARPKHKIITVDYNGCELRILAEYSKERAFVDAFLKDWDVHSVGAEIIYGQEWHDSAVREAYVDENGKKVPLCAYYYDDHKKCSCPKHKKLRDAIKSINFGIAYGMEAKKLAETISVSEDDAKKLLAKYRAAFPTLIKYLELSGNTAVIKLESRTLAGRRRCYTKPNWNDAVAKAAEELREGETVPSSRKIAQKYKAMHEAIKREGKNTPIQGSNADMAKIAMGCGFDKNGTPFMWHGLGQFQARLLNFVHDEFVVECPEEYAEACYHFVGDCMKRAGAELVHTIVMEYEGHIADRWKK